VNEDYLVTLAQELICRVRDDDPESNGRWLMSTTTEADRFALLFVLAAAVPDDVPWSALVGWTRPDGRVLRPHGTSAAVGRHQARHEKLCPPCAALQRERGRARRLADRLSTGVSTAETPGYPQASTSEIPELALGPDRTAA
jgi:hypothetical protein